MTHPKRGGRDGDFRASGGERSGPLPWERGGPSPNPRGRPRKDSIATFLPRKLYPWAAEFLEFDRRWAGIQDASGKDLTLGEAFLSSLYRRAFKDNRAAALYARMREAAYAAETNVRMKLIEEVNYHRERYLPQFEQAEAEGRAPPQVYPDPREIELMPDGDVRFHGPVDAMGKLQLDAVLAMRDQLLDALDTIVIDDPARREDLLSVRNYLRRRIYKLNRLIPKHQRKRIPALKVHPSVGRAGEGGS